jgi:hypothetical protein
VSGRTIRDPPDSAVVREERVGNEWNGGSSDTSDL